MAEFSSGNGLQQNSILGGGVIGGSYAVYRRVEVFMLLCWDHGGTNTGSVFKTYPPNLKGFKAKTTRKWCFFNLYLMEFGSEWQPCKG